MTKFSGDHLFNHPLVEVYEECYRLVYEANRLAEKANKAIPDAKGMLYQEMYSLVEGMRFEARMLASVLDIRIQNTGWPDYVLDTLDEIFGEGGMEA
ncbi:hypothetical protein KZP23_07490 [Echinicola marina]|uniref:hypothetical protein n=1 Tax=Echinicola marina TaxID=2859768 RepID=UPI001CF643F4|nr:hypothetical protein [Echinicola marina]UCS94843.1 hypothetical protein KZP23_07490 [Echinicola marina]